MLAKLVKKSILYTHTHKHIYIYIYIYIYITACVGSVGYSHYNASDTQLC